MYKRVVITGTGIIGPVGKTADESWKNALSGVSGIRRMSLIDPEQFTSQIAGEVREFDPLDYFDRKLEKRIDRYAQFAMIAAREAYEGSEIEGRVQPERLGVIIGSGIGGIATLENEHKVAMERGVGRINPFFCPMMISNIAAGRVGIDLNAKGLNFATVTACATSGHAIAVALDMIRLGRADAILAGGSEAPITLTGVGGFCQLKALSTRNDDPETASRPFDIGRDGFVISEGGAVLLMEELEHARSRGADIIAEIVGAGMTCDAYHITAPAEGGEGSARAMVLAIEDAGIKPADVDYINAHGTSTQLNDINETEAIKSALGLEKAMSTPVSSTKSVTGHMLGAAGAVEAIFTAFSLREGILPPTATLVEPDEGCDLDYVPGRARKADITYALSNSLGFGGHNVTITLKKYSG
ncbi:MAG: beta-ketoacyl-ACP synthase II [Candidatus Fermentibacteraceae bacterium]|nr:beta-ketoacyl-ACP synthase II [Candidatus Fermentibacteraceae bacterium]MBN2608993.1 beta-ketoacyl-ACP synthase II [Candidatus Fermentibacteraceae bacterium]